MSVEKQSEIRDESGRMASYYRIVLLIISAVVVGLQAAAMGPLRDSLWGFHLYAFLPPVIAIVGWLVLAGAAVWLLFLSGRNGNGTSLSSSGFLNRILDTPLKTAGITIAFAAICTVLFWAFRSNQTLLGDALPLTADLPTGKSFHPRQPITMWLQHVLYQHLGGFFRSDGVSDSGIAHRTVALGSVVTGFFFVGVVCALGFLYARGRSLGKIMPWLLALLLLTQGYIVLFYGYVENYTYYTLSIGLYLFLSVRFLRGTSPLILPALTLVLATGLHFSAATLFPSFALLSVWGLVTPEKRLGTIRDLVIMGAVSAAMYLVFAAVQENYNLFSELLEVSFLALTRKQEVTAHYMFSPNHFRDFFNEHFLIGPLGLFFFLPAAAAALLRRDRSNIATVFFMVAGFSFLITSWLAGESNLGYARNWDLFAPAGLCFTAAGSYYLVQHVPDKARLLRLLVFALILSVVHTAPWIWINHSEALSLARFKSLPLGEGRTEVVVGNWYMRNGDAVKAEQWYEKSLKAYPKNVNAYYLLGILYTNNGHWEPACAMFEVAVRLRPDKVEHRRKYVAALLQVNRCADAVPHLIWQAKRYPTDFQYWQRIGDDMIRLGCGNALTDIYPPVLAAAGNLLQSNPEDAESNFLMGTLLVKLNRYDEALQMFQRTLRADPESPSAIFNTAMVLIELGRQDEARPLLERFITLFPDHPMKRIVEKKLRE